MSIFSFIKSKISIVNVIEEYVRLKPAGGYLKGSCPFHSETDASFTLSPEKEIFYCFGCHATGDSIAFIAKIENLNQIEASLYLAEKYNIEIPQDIKRSVNSSDEQKQEKQLYLEACKAIATWAHEELANSSLAREYLSKRNIDQKDINYFKIGYVPGGPRSITRLINTMKSKGILLKNLLECGFVAESSSLYYSPFEERILFPIKDHQGRICGFGGRIFRDKDERPKYYNSRESELFIKGKLLFGIDLAKKSMQQKKSAFLVEGYTDCVAMVKYGYENTVATLGTACTIEHLKLLARQIETLHVLYDGDNAGQNAILRLTELCWEVNLDLNIIELPSKEDPASFLNKGGNLEELIKKSCDIFSFFIEKTGSNFNELSLSEKMGRSKKIIDLISKIDDSLKQAILLQKTSMVTNLPFEALKSLLNKQENEAQYKNSKNELAGSSRAKDAETEEDFGAIPLLEKKIFFAMINSTKNASTYTIDKELIQYFSPQMQKLLNKFLKTYDPGKSEGLSNFFESLSENDMAWVNKHLMLLNDLESLETFEQLIFQFRKQKWRKIVQDIKNELIKAEEEGNVEAVQKLTARFLMLKQEIKHEGLL